MKCSKCGSDNLAGASFCVSCGSKLEGEINPQNNVNMQNTNNVNKKPKSKWLTIGLPIAIVVIVLIALISNSNDSSYSSSGSYESMDARTQFGNYLVTYGFTRNSSTNYTMYSDGYLITIDFNDAIMSMEDSSMYTAYYYKSNIFGVAAVNDGLQIVSTYNLSTYEYICETEPSTYQSYTCSYVKSSFIELAEAERNAFNALATSAGVSARDL